MQNDKHILVLAEFFLSMPDIVKSKGVLITKNPPSYWNSQVLGAITLTDDSGQELTKQ